MRVKKNKKGLVPLDNYLESLAVCGDFVRAAESAGVSDKQLEQWFNHHDICRMMAEARANAQLRKDFIAPCMTREQFVAALKWCQKRSTRKQKGKRAERDNAIIKLLVNHPDISDAEGARKMRITLGAYTMRKKRLLKALFNQLTIG
jgi:hypothetical protein